MNYLFYISENYSFEILRPLQQEVLRRGHQAAWFVEGNRVNLNLFKPDERYLPTTQEAVEFNPVAVFVPGNFVPSFISGLKVQLFHGFEWKKKGHFRMRGMFDLYCTQGPLFTKKFEQLKSLQPHFNVVETGWPKMDTLFNSQPYEWLAQDPALKTVLFAPTFSPSLTSAPALFEEISRLVQQREWQWLIKFHPKMEPSWIQKFKSLKFDNLHVVESETIAPVLLAADVMISDTSSIITEFGLINRPIITYNNLSPESHLLDISDPQLLETSIDKALKPNPELLTQIKKNIIKMHPYSDGKSSMRIMDAVDGMINSDRSSLKAKPLNILRSLKLRKKLSYWKF
jgi:CDP-glycerol glycerophosphotransferase (TagB/SpsB family)